MSSYFTRPAMAICLFFFLVLSVYSVIELSNRAAALHFAKTERSRIRAEISAVADVENPNDTDTIRMGKSTERRLNKLVQEMSVLTFSGASEESKTVYAHMMNYFDEALTSEATAAERVANQRITIDQEEILFITNIETLIENFDSGGKPDSANDFEARLRSTSAGIPTLVEASNPSEQIVRGFDLLILSILSESEGRELDVLQYDRVRDAAFDSLRRLGDRQEELALRVEENQILITDLKEAGAASMDGSNLPVWASYVPFLYFLSSLPSDLILTIAIVAAGGVGALFVGLHTKDGEVFSRIAKGCIAGFVGLLVIKGGGFLFSLDTQSVIDANNPYSAAFVGVLGGLFTDRIFEGLRRLVFIAADKLGTAEEQSQESDKMVGEVTKGTDPKDVVVEKGAD